MSKGTSSKPSKVEAELGVSSSALDAITEKVAVSVSGLIGQQVAAALERAGLPSGEGAASSTRRLGAVEGTSGASLLQGQPVTAAGASATRARTPEPLRVSGRASPGLAHPGSAGAAGPRALGLGLPP